MYHIYAKNVIKNYMPLQDFRNFYVLTKKLIMTTFIESQFNYCPLVWMFHSRTLNNKINQLHEMADLSIKMMNYPLKNY